MSMLSSAGPTSWPGKRPLFHQRRTSERLVDEARPLERACLANESLLTHELAEREAASRTSPAAWLHYRPLSITMQSPCTIRTCNSSHVCACATTAKPIVIQPVPSQSKQAQENHACAFACMRAPSQVTKGKGAQMAYKGWLPLPRRSSGEAPHTPQASPLRCFFCALVGSSSLDSSPALFFARFGGFVASRQARSNPFWRFCAGMAQVRRGREQCRNAPPKASPLALGLSGKPSSVAAPPADPLRPPPGWDKPRHATMAGCGLQERMNEEGTSDSEGWLPSCCDEPAFGLDASVPRARLGDTTSGGLGSQPRRPARKPIATALRQRAGWRRGAGQSQHSSPLWSQSGEILQQVSRISSRSA